MNNDLISRTALISSFLNRQRSENEIKNHTISGEDVIAMIQNAPSFEEKRHQGEWRRDVVGLYCSICQGRAFVTGTNYCPFCGAAMGGSES